MKKQNQTGICVSINIKKILTIVTASYIILIVLFYWLMGDQLHYRTSRENIEQPPAESGTVELSQGIIVEQTFSVGIQRLQSVSVQWGTYYRSNMGTVTMELVNMIDGSIILDQSFDISAISEGGFTTMTAEIPIETVSNVPLVLRIYADSPPGNAASPLMSLSTLNEDYSLFINGIPTNGMLCMAVSGEDYIWTGLHYWEFATVGLTLLLILSSVVYFRYSCGKHSYVANAIIALKKYKFLIWQLIGRDFKTKYKRSVLGIFWSFLNPLLTMFVQYFVFSTIFKSDVPNYAAYLIIGSVMFNFFSEASNMALISILGNAGLITKVYMPKYIYPLTRVISSVVNLGMSLIPMLIVCMVTKVLFHRSVLLALFFLMCLVIFSLGLGLLLSTFMVFFRDTQFLWGVLSMMWMYATPIFYPENIIPENLKFIYTLNPLYHFLKNTRMCILSGISPEPVVYVQCFLIAFGALLIGALVFHKNQDKFILYL